MAFSRNYFADMHDLGMSYNDIAEATGVSKSTARRYALEITDPKPKTHKKASNDFRREHRRKLRRDGASPDEADLLRGKRGAKQTKRKTKTANKGFIQLILTVEMVDGKNKEKRIVTGYSAVYRKLNANTRKKMMKEALKNAQANAGGTNWKKYRIIEEKYQRRV